MISHTCIKCKIKYEDDEVDDYLCSICNTERLRIAKEVDAKLASRPKKQTMTDYKILQERGQSRGEATFVKASDLGITF